MITVCQNSISNRALVASCGKINTNRANITNWGRIITNRGRYYKLGQLLQIGVEQFQYFCCVNKVFKINSKILLWVKFLYIIFCHKIFTCSHFFNASYSFFALWLNFLYEKCKYRSSHLEIVLGNIVLCMCVFHFS